MDSSSVIPKKLPARGKLSHGRRHPPETRYETLKEAILQRDRGTIVWYINEGCPVNDYQVDRGQSDTPLHLAVFTGDPGVVGLLISAGADVNAANFHKQTPLHLAFEMGHSGLVDLLLAECRDGRVNPFTSYGLSHFHIACVRNDWRVVGAYLEGGVNANVYLEKSFYGKDYVYYRPLHLAVKYHNLEVAELLLRHGANVSAKDRYKRTPLHLACSYNHRRICETIADAESPSDALHRLKAENDDQVDIVKLLLKYGADVDALDSHGMPPLVHVFKCNYREIKKAIRDKVDTDDRKFWKEAIEIFKSIQRKKFDLLLQQGVSPGFCTDGKDTLLHLVIDGRKLFACGGHTTRTKKEQGLNDEEKAEIVDLLLKYAVDVEAKNSNGQTALQMAISMYLVETVKILLNNRASVKNVCFFHYKIPKRELGGSFDLEDMENFLEIVSLMLREKFKLNLNRINELLVVRYMNTDASVRLIENCSISDLRYLLDFGDVNKMDVPSYICERTVLTEREKIALILQHVQKLEIAGLYVSDEIKRGFSRYQGIVEGKRSGSEQMFADTCRDEIDRMKGIMIDRYASFYDLLFLNVNEVAVRVKNREFRRSVRTNCSTKLVVYNDIVVKQFVKGLARSILLGLAKRYLSFVIGLEFPDPCSERIISYLTNEDLCNLALAFEK